jgi:hypothetical protein
MFLSFQSHDQFQYGYEMQALASACVLGTVLNVHV